MQLGEIEKPFAVSLMLHRFGDGIERAARLSARAVSGQLSRCADGIGETSFNDVVTTRLDVHLQSMNMIEVMQAAIFGFDPHPGLIPSLSKLLIV